MKTPTILLTLLLTAALTACGSPAPPPPAICARASDHVRVEDRLCGDTETGLLTDGPEGPVVILIADPDCLDADDHTEIGAVADDDYLEGCDEDGHAKARSSSKTTTKKAPATTTKKRPIARPTS